MNTRVNSIGTTCGSLSDNSIDTWASVYDCVTSTRRETNTKIKSKIAMSYYKK